MTASAGPAAPAADGGALNDARSRICAARDQWDARAQQSHDRRRRFGIVVALVSPLTVLLAAVQIEHFPSGPVALALATGQLVLLASALVVGLLQLGRSHDEWIANRLRVELLRREEFLLLARVGPYLTGSESTLPRLVAARLVLLQAPEVELVSFLDLEEGGSRPWRHELEDACDRGASAGVPSLADEMQRYLDARLDRQRVYFEQRCAQLRDRDRLCEHIVHGVLILAVLVVMIQIGGLWRGEHGEGLGERPWLLLVADILALILPPLGAATVAIRSLFEFNRLASSYSTQAHALAVLENRFLKLLSELEQAPRAAAEREFKRLVLQGEESLAGELRNWWVLLAPQRPSPGP